MTKKTRCFGDGSKIYEKYHDTEWGKPVFDDNLLFEMLILEGAQAGLSWETVLKKRTGYRDSFYNFEVEKVAKMSDKELQKLRENPRIIRNRLKIFSARKNAQIFQKIQIEYGSFANYLWKFVDEKPIKNHWKSVKEIPVSTKLSDKISQDLKTRGMSFVGSVIIYAYLQSVGVVIDHPQDCMCY